MESRAPHFGLKFVSSAACLGTNSWKTNLLLLLPLELFKLTHGSVHKQVQAAELVPVVLRGRRRGRPEHGARLGHVQGPVVLVVVEEVIRLERAQVGRVGQRHWVRGWGRGQRRDPRGRRHGPVVAVVLLAAAAWAHGDQ